jgi:hypothetical protein
MAENKQVYVDFIIGELEKGNIAYKDVCAVFCGKFQLSERTFNKYWLDANEAYRIKRDAIEKEKLGVTIALEKEAVIREIADKLETMEFLTRVMRGRGVKLGEHHVYPSFNERTAAAKLMVTIQGWEAPKKLDHTTLGEKITNRVILYDNGRHEIEED